MKINQALKKKNKLAGKIAQLTSRIQQNNRFEKGKPPIYDVDVLFKERQIAQNELNKLKIDISKATLPILSRILALAEIKGDIASFKGLSSKTGEERNYGSDEPIEYVAVIDELKRDKMVEAWEEEISDLQDSIDHHNAVTDI